MENTLLKDLKNRYSIYNMVIFLLGIGLLVVIYGLKISEIIIRKDYQWEVREGAGFWLAQRFANGVNPYVFHEGVPEPVYMYGFLLPILLSVVIKLAGISKAIIIAQIITILVEICGVVLFGRILKRSGVSFSLIPIGMLCLVSCYFRYGAYSGVFPDAYGITMLLLIWYILQSDELNARLRPFLYASLCIIIFYIKQYFVFITLGFVIYFVMKRAYKELAQFIIFGSVVGGVTIILTRIVFPTYFTTNTYFLGIYNNYSLSFSIRQFSYIFFSYILIFIIFSIGVIVHFYVSELKCFLSNKFALSQGIGMFFVGVWLSTSDGAWITYYLQLFLPFIIFAGVVSWEELRNILLVTRKDNIHHICLSLLELVMIFFLMFSIKGYLLIDRIGKEYVDQWEEMYGVLDSYTGKNMKVSALPLTYYCIKNNIYCDNPGHSNCYTYELLDMVYNEKSWKILFPFAKELTEQYLNYYEDTLQKCSEGYYDCIILQESDYWKEKTEIAMGSMYKKYGEYTLKCGTEDWVCIVYIKK